MFFLRNISIFPPSRIHAAFMMETGCGSTRGWPTPKGWPVYERGGGKVRASYGWTKRWDAAGRGYSTKEKPMKGQTFLFVSNVGTIVRSQNGASTLLKGCPRASSESTNYIVPKKSPTQPVWQRKSPAANKA